MSRTPHDKLFKRIFKEPQHAADELRAVLPSSLVEALDWSSLKSESESHVEESLADSYSDLIFSAKAGDTTVIVYILFEHQSTNDERMALRLLGYMVQIWLRFVEDNSNATKPLPLIVPVVLSHAVGGWTAKTRFADLFTEDALSLVPNAVPDFEYAVDDLDEIDSRALRARHASEAVKLTLWVLRDARRGPVFLAAAGDWVAVLEALARDPHLRHVANAIVMYLFRVLDDEIMRAFHVMLATEAPVAEGLTMTYAEKLITQSLERGRTEGKLEGKLEGDLQRASKSVLLVLETRGLVVSDEQRARIEACTDAEALADWLKAAVTASSTADIFGE